MRNFPKIARLVKLEQRVKPVKSYCRDSEHNHYAVLTPEEDII